MPPDFSKSVYKSYSLLSLYLERSQEIKTQAIRETIKIFFIRNDPFCAINLVKTATAAKTIILELVFMNVVKVNLMPT